MNVPILCAIYIRYIFVYYNLYYMYFVGFISFLLMKASVINLRRVGKNFNFSTMRYLFIYLFILRIKSGLVLVYKMLLKEFRDNLHFF